MKKWIKARKELRRWKEEDIYKQTNKQTNKRALLEEFGLCSISNVPEITAYQKRPSSPGRNTVERNVRK